MKWSETVITLVTLLLATSIAGQVTESPAPGQDPSGRTLIVGTKEAVPFAIKGPDDRWSGISVDLLDQVMNDLGWEYRLRNEPLDELLRDVETGELDLAISAITITPEREISLDFSHGYYSTGLGIAVSGEGGGWRGFMSRLLSPQFGGAIGLTIGCLLLVGWLVWLAERRKNPEQFGGSLPRGVGEGFWFSAVTMTTVGYGDRAPVTKAGRALALVWMFTSLVAISSLTAAITSALTLNELQSGVSGPADLPDVRVGTVAASTSLAYLRDMAVSPREYPSALDALRALDEGEVEAVVYDAPILRYQINEEFPGDLALLPDVFNQQDYAVAFGPGSELREPFNRALLRVMDAPAWRGIKQRYLGSGEE